MEWNYTMSSTTLNNWMTAYHLECSPVSPFFSMANIAGYAVSNLIAPPIIDKFGKKACTIFRTVFQAVLYFVLVALPKGEDKSGVMPYVIIGILFVLGLVN